MKTFAHSDFRMNHFEHPRDCIVSFNVNDAGRNLRRSGYVNDASTFSDGIGDNFDALAIDHFLCINIEKGAMDLRPRIDFCHGSVAVESLRFFIYNASGVFFKVRWYLTQV